MRTTMIRRATNGLLLVAMACAGGAEAAGTLALRLGRPHVVGESTVAVPVRLVTHRAPAIAALNFDLQYDPNAIAAGAVTAGPAVTRAGAELTSRAEDG